MSSSNFARAYRAADALFACAEDETGAETLILKCIRAGKAVVLYWNITAPQLNAANGVVAPAPFDPVAAPAISIFDPNGAEQLTAAAMTKVQSGLYSYEYTTPALGALGIWSAYVDIVDAAGNPAGSAYDAGQTKTTPVFQLV